MTIDLTNGYWQLGMAPSSARFMGFEWEGQTYVFGVLPFGLASAPWAFTQFMKAFCSYLRSLGWRLINYLDDFTFPVSPKELQAAQEAGLILAEFREAGLCINVPKSMLQPSTQARSLGFLLDTVAGIFMVPQDRWDIFTTVVKRLLLQGGGSARLVAASAGHAISMKLVLGQVARLLTRDLLGLVANTADDQWDLWVDLSPEATEELLFWASLKREDCTSPIWPVPAVTTLTINTDASETAWGAVSPLGTAHGYLTSEQRGSSSSLRELVGILGALQSYGEQLRGHSVRLLTDSTNAISAMDHGSRAPGIHRLAVQIFWRCQELGLTLCPEWVPRALNVEADLVSRHTDFADWKLSPQWFALLTRRWGPFTVDRFASASNTLLPRFNSYYFTSGCEVVDCFSQD